MVYILLVIMALALILLTFIGLAFFISCILEKEKRAGIFAGLQFFGMLILVVVFLMFIKIGFFEIGAGLVILVATLLSGAVIPIVLFRRAGGNSRALEGTKGLTEGEVTRCDERDVVFARNRILTESVQYETYYRMHPEHEEYDSKRRMKGGPLGFPGLIDRPQGGTNVAAALASLSIPEVDQKETNGVIRWKLNEKTCFEYWGKIGTDCNVCMRVCPWSHGRNFPHNLIVWLITRNNIARRLFSIVDDIFYGKKPKSKTPPRWAAYG